MRLSGNTVLITGGSEGVGFELARALVPANTVIVCGRSEAKLERAKATLPGLHVIACDLTDPTQREALVASVLASHPELDLLINNAGGRTLAELSTGVGVEQALHADLALNFIAPASLCAKLLGHLRERPRAGIVNVTTGLVYLPKAAQPFYCAAKAGLHSYTQSLRWAVRESTIRVHEVLLPLVDTGFHGGELPDTVPAMTAEEAARRTLDGIARGKQEIRVGKSALARWLALLAPGRGMALLNR